MAEELDKTIELAAEVLKSHGAKEVYVFGSAIKKKLRRHSDVDMAVVGLPARVFFRAMSDASDVLGRPVDLVNLDKPTAFTRYLRRAKDLKRVG